MAGIGKLEVTFNHNFRNAIIQLNYIKKTTVILHGFYHFKFPTSTFFNNLNMISSIDLQLERELFLAVLMIFFGAGFLCTLITFIIHLVEKKKKKGSYYFLVFLISGITAISLAVYLCMSFIK